MCFADSVNLCSVVLLHQREPELPCVPPLFDAPHPTDFQVTPNCWFEPLVLETNRFLNNNTYSEYDVCMLI